MVLEDQNFLKTLFESSSSLYITSSLTLLDVGQLLSLLSEVTLLVHLINLPELLADSGDSLSRLSEINNTQRIIYFEFR